MSVTSVDEGARVVTRRPSSSRPLLVGELVIVAVLFFAYDHIRALAPTRRLLALQDAGDVVQLERMLHVDVELVANLWTSAHSSLALAASWYYQLLHLTVTAIVLGACYLRRPDLYRWARNAMVGICAAGLLVFWLYPVAPPRLMPHLGFIDTAVATGVVGPTSLATTPDPYAAMPSLHIAWAVWAGAVAVLMVRRPRARFMCLAYPVVTSVVVVATGNHFILDVVAGALLAIAALWVSARSSLGWPAGSTDTWSAGRELALVGVQRSRVGVR